MKYWEDQRCNITTAKVKIPQKCRICNTCFTYVAFVGGKFYSSHPKNRNHFNKDQNDLLYGIIVFGTNVSDSDTIFYD